MEASACAALSTEEMALMGEALVADTGALLEEKTPVGWALERGFEATAELLLELAHPQLQGAFVGPLEGLRAHEAALDGVLVPHFVRLQRADVPHFVPHFGGLLTDMLRRRCFGGLLTDMLRLGLGASSNTFS